MHGFACDVELSRSHTAFPKRFKPSLIGTAVVCRKAGRVGEQRGAMLARQHDRACALHAGSLAWLRRLLFAASTWHAPVSVPRRFAVRVATRVANVAVMPCPSERARTSACGPPTRLRSCLRCAARCAQGKNIRKSTVDFADADVRDILATNVESAFAMCQACHAMLAAAGAGAVIFNSSVAGGPTAMCSGAVYAMSKGALSSMPKSRNSARVFSACVLLFCVLRCMRAFAASVLCFYVLRRVVVSPWPAATLGR